jgi:hypothetical protein
MKMTEAEMQTIADAVRLLSTHGMMSVKIGKGNLIPAAENRPRVGPLTLAQEKATGEVVYLLADSGFAVRLEDLTFRMAVNMTKAKTAKAGK